MNFGKSKPAVTKGTEPTVVFPSSMTEVLTRSGPVSIIELIECCIDEAHQLRASDIHISPNENDVTVRLRIDGVLQSRCTFSKNILQEVISRIKVLSNLRTDEHQAAQDGRFRITTKSGATIDVRVSVTPTYFGENAVLRLLADHSSAFTLELLGFSESDQAKIEKAIKEPHGMILATGPTGSGKTTTLDDITVTR